MERHDFILSSRASAGARQWLQRVLERAGLRDPDGSLALMLSEVVTNAVQHAGTPGHVTFERLGDGARITVNDLGPGLPVVRADASATGGGWGLRFVDTLADSWGVDPTEGGKTVWFELGALHARSS